MGLHISAIILTEWLLLAGWFNGEKSIYNWGALVVVLMWGLGWQRDVPRWPASKMFQMMIYFGFGFLTLLIFFLTKTNLAFLSASLIFIFMVVDFAKEKNQ